MQFPSVSVIIVNWNHGRFIKACLEAILAQEYPHFYITIVDNGSTDGSPRWISDNYPHVKLWAFPDNRGFSWAINWGVSHTNSDLVLSLNPDVVVRADFISEMVKAMDMDERAGMVAPKLLRADNPSILDSTGLFIDRRRRPYDRGQGENDCGQYDTQLFVFGACGAAALYRRVMLVDLAPYEEYFDELFFAYYEDADLAWRAQLKGWTGIYAPRAIATHVRGWGDTLRKGDSRPKDARGPRLALRNRYLMTCKNDALKYFLFDLPLILMAEIPRLVYALLTAPGVLLGIVDLVRGLPSALRKRQQIRAQRFVDDAIIRQWFVNPTDSAVIYRQ